MLAIKQTLYRTGGDEAGIVASLAKAAEAGKQVVALVELKARFDEQANIERARMLEQAGVHVVYGLVGLKTHAKVLLVVRQEADGIRRYCHVGTGNYNPKTATLYEDLGVLLGRPRARRRPLGALQPPHRLQPPAASCGDCIVAPMRRCAPSSRSASREQGRPGGRIIDEDERARRPRAHRRALRRRRRRAPRSTSLVRGICCLRPGVPGLSERIRVRSIVGRFLEHSRIFRFGDRPTRPTEYLIGSADLMPRNLDRRVEALLPVTGSALQARLDEILEVELADDVARVGAGSRRHVEKVRA